MLRTRATGTLVSALALALVLTATVAGAESDGPAAAPTADAAVEGRGHVKKMMMNPYMLIPQLITLGFAPIVLANLKMMVMSALMINNMALNAAIFMTIRNMVFGPRPTVKYNNYGYRHPPHHHHKQFEYQHHQHGEQQQQFPGHSVDTITSEVRRRRRDSALTHGSRAKK